MSTATDNDLREVKELISQLGDRMNDRFNQVDNRFNQIDEKITDLRINQTEVQTRLNDWKPSIDKTADLSEKIGELRNWKQIAIVLLTGFITSVF
jgi:chromosome segregation ATPase